MSTQITNKKHNLILKKISRWSFFLIVEMVTYWINSGFAVQPVKSAIQVVNFIEFKNFVFSTISYLIIQQEK